MMKQTTSIGVDVMRDDYNIRFSIRLYVNWRKMVPEQRATILRAVADQLETWASQVRAEAEEMIA